MKLALTFITTLFITTCLYAWDDVKNYTFSISSSSVTESETYLEENVSTSLGTADVFFYVNTCTMVADSAGMTMTGISGSGLCGIQYRFDQPVDLTDADLIRIIQTHSDGRNRVSGIYFSLPDFKQLELRNLATSPFLNNQNQYALYNFESSFDSWVHLPRNISRITIEFDILLSETIFLESLSLETSGERMDLAALIELGGTRDLSIQSSRKILSEELVRLEASFDLVHWFEKSSFAAGTGEFVIFDKYFIDSNFYRFRWHPVVEPVGVNND